jgi:HEAT repeat protein
VIFDHKPDNPPPVERASASGSCGRELRRTLATFVLVAGVLSLPVLADQYDGPPLLTIQDSDPAPIASRLGLQGRSSSHALNGNLDLPGRAKVDFGAGPRAGVLILAGNDRHDRDRTNRGQGMRGDGRERADRGQRTERDGRDRADHGQRTGNDRAGQSQRAEHDRGHHYSAPARQSQRSDRARERHESARTERSLGARRGWDQHSRAERAQHIERQHYEYDGQPQRGRWERADPDQRAEREHYGLKLEDEQLGPSRVGKRLHQQEPGESMPPKDIQLSEDTFDENAEFRASLTATDKDSAPEDLTFTLQGDPTGGLFVVDGDQLTLVEPLNFENLPMNFEQSDGSATVVLTLEVVDEDGNQFREGIPVTVNEVAESPTDIQLSTNVFDENTAFSATLSATDPDSAPEDLSFAIGSDPTGVFAISGNQLTLEEPVDFEDRPAGFSQQGTVDISVDVVDEAGNKLSSSFSLTVNDVDDDLTDVAAEGEQEDQGRTEPPTDLAGVVAQAVALGDIGVCEQWIRTLISDHSVVRCYAALALASLTNDVASSALASSERWLIGARDPRETSDSLESLALVSGFLSAALPALVDARADWDPPVRYAARDALRTIDAYADHTIDLLDELGLARHPDPRIARSSMRVLGNLGMHAYGREEAHDVVAEALNHRDLGVRYYAAQGVLQIDEDVKAVAAAANRGGLDGGDDIPELAVALQVSPVLKEGAVGTLGDLGPYAVETKDQLIGQLRAGDAPAKAAAVEELGDFGLFVTSPLPVLVEAPSIQERVTAGKAPSDLYAMLTVPDLLEALEDEDTRLATTGYLGEVGAVATTASVDLERIKTEESGSDAAIMADDVLTTISGHSEEAVVALLGAGKGQTTDEQAVRALGYLGSQATQETSADAVFALIDVLKQGSPDAQSEAATALARFTEMPEATVPALTQALRAGNPVVRYESARALGRLRAPAAVPELREALTADDIWLRYHAALALQQIEGAPDPGMDDLQGILQAVDEQSDRAVAVLVAAVESGDSEAERTLRHIGPPATAAVPGLLDVLRQATPDDQHRIAALIRAVSASSLPEIRVAIDDLESADDPAVRTRAAWALGNVGVRARTVLPTLTRELSATERPANFDGVQALSEIGTTTAAAINALVLAALADDDGDVRQAARESLREYAAVAAEEVRVASN